MSVAWLAFLGLAIADGRLDVRSDGFALLAWGALVAVANLLPVKVDGAGQLVPDAPVLVAAALVFSPVQAGVLATVTSMDVMEFRREVRVPRALFNRTAVGVACFLGSLAGHWLAALTDDYNVLLTAALVIAVEFGVNTALNTVTIAAELHVSWVQVTRKFMNGSPADYGLTWVAWAVLGAMLTVFYAAVGYAALIAVVVLLLMTRQVLARGQLVREGKAAYAARERALVKLSQSIYEERRDERRIICADLHDEVLQPIFKVSLMTEVVRKDLSNGRLLELEDDVNQLRDAASAASETLRRAIGNLRRADLGTGSVSDALTSLVERLRGQTEARLLLEVEEIRADPGAQLTVYQIAKEALENAVTHSKALTIRVCLREERELVVLEVIDEGIGFDPGDAREGHFGLEIMRERAMAAGGSLFADSAPGAGCTITALVPGRTNAREL
jgi:signal transduction histidine kinase